MRARGMRGFTLIELLVALALTSVILVTLYSAFFTADRAIGSSGEMIERLHEARTALDVLKREIEGSLTYNEAADRDRFVVLDRDLYGYQASRLSLSTAGSVLPGAARVAYYVDEKDGRRRLMKRVSGIAYDPDSSDAKSMEAEIAADIVSFEIEARSKEGWTKTWQENTLPVEVRITLTIAVAPGRDLAMVISAVPRVGRKG